jgi:hypothetical protein
MDRRVLYVAQQ